MASTTRQTVATATVNVKIADLQKDIIGPRGLTTDHGVLVSDTDNCYTAFSFLLQFGKSSS